MATLWEQVSMFWEFLSRRFAVPSLVNYFWGTNGRIPATNRSVRDSFKMENFVENLARTYFTNNRDHFAEDAVYQGFVMGDGSLRKRNVYPAVAYGYFTYRSNDRIQLSNRMRIQYYACADGGSERQHTLDRWFECETAFYGLLWPNLPQCDRERRLVGPEFRASRMYRARGVSAGAAIFAALRGHHCWGYGRCLDSAHLSLMAAAIGRFHGAVYRAQAADPRLLERMPDWRQVYSGEDCLLVRATLLRCLRPLLDDERRGRDEQYARGISRLADMVIELDERVALALGGGQRHCHTVCHRNYTQASVAFEYDDGDLLDARIGNWAMAGLGSVGVDLVFWLFVELDPADGDALRNRLLADYWTALSGGAEERQLPTLAQILVEVKRCVPLALFALAARVERYHAVPSLNMRPRVSGYWDDGLVATVFRQLIEHNWV